MARRKPNGASSVYLGSRRQLAWPCHGWASGMMARRIVDMCAGSTESSGDRRRFGRWRDSGTRGTVASGRRSVDRRCVVGALVGEHRAS